jgi:translation initiation factor 5A
MDGVKRSLVSPVSANVEVPIIDKRTGQVVSISGNIIQLMDLESFEYFETPKPIEEAEKYQSGVEVEYWRVMGRTKLVRIKS